MTTPEDQIADMIDWAVAARPIAGEAVSGDLHLVTPFAGGVLIAAVDGLGHGEEATLVANSAIAILSEYSHEPVIPLIRRCHEALLRTRGAAMTLASLHATERTLTWLGVGNVEGRLVRPDGMSSPRRESVLLRSGIVGFQLPAMQAGVEALAPGDLLILATDGIHAHFDEDDYFGGNPAQIADRILEKHFKGTDDALVLVVRYRGQPHAT